MAKCVFLGTHNQKLICLSRRWGSSIDELKDFHVLILVLQVWATALKLLRFKSIDHTHKKSSNQGMPRQKLWYLPGHLKIFRQIISSSNNRSQIPPFSSPPLPLYLLPKKNPKKFEQFQSKFLFCNNSVNANIIFCCLIRLPIWRTP